jgi:hypothetical protein
MINEELLEWNSSGFVQKTEIKGRRDSLRSPRSTHYPQIRHYLAKWCDRSFGIVHSRAESPGVCLVFSFKNAVFWEAKPCGCCKHRRFERTYRRHHHGEENQRARNDVIINYQLKHAQLKLFVTVNVGPSSLIILIAMMEAISSSKTSVLTRATRRHIQEDILHNHCSERLSSFIALTGWAL